MSYTAVSSQSPLAFAQQSEIAGSTLTAEVHSNETTWVPYEVH